MGLEERQQPLDATMLMPASLGGITPLVQDLLRYIETWRMQQRLDRIVVLHHRPLSGSAYAPHLVHLVPVDLTHFYTLMSEPWPSRSLPTFSLDADALLSALLRQYVFVSLYRAVAESLASEHASRLVSMQAAERSIAERLDELQAQFRYQRQHAITEELLDIISGFEAMGGLPGMEATPHVRQQRA
jgi:F-type H+-transporting ATPase subunit gamma